ncbi:tryptophan-rich sensory protein [Clostridia bacterium]|nr:tryptophan-rich sensory protein [Clostridia bacterium]
MIKNIQQNIIVAIFFLVMVGVNVLANLLPINGVNTGQVSAELPNLFVPDPVTFSIWGLIYLLLFGYVVYNFVIHEDDRRSKLKELNQLARYFCISSFLNACWILSWHYGLFILSTIVMLFLLLSLILARLSIEKMTLRGREKLFIRLPFSIYLAWISIATIASITTALVYLAWDGFGISPIVWTIAVLLVGLLISGATMLRFQDGVYGLVIMWAYAGIVRKHLSVDGYAGMYPSIVVATVACIVGLILLEIYLIKKGKFSA